MKGRKISPALQVVLVLVGVVVVAALGYVVLISPQGGKIKAIKAKEDQASQELSDYRHKVVVARSAPHIRIADVYRLAKAMPSQLDMPDLLLELSQLARNTGIRFDSISPQPLVVSGAYTVQPISVTFNGTFYDLADLLYRLRSLVDVHAGRLDATGRLFSVDTLTFAESPLKFPRIQATLTVDAFVYGNATAAAAASSSAPPAPTTTGTTTTSATSTNPTPPTQPTTTSSTSASATGAH